MPPIDSKQDVNSLLSYLVEPMASIRSRRRYIEDEWLRNYAAWQGWPTVTHFLPLPDGSIRYFIPVARRAIERINARIVKLLMPQAKWFEVQPFDSGEPDSHKKAESVDSLFRYLYEKKIKSKRIMSAATRCLQLYNFSAMCTSPRVVNDEVWPHQRVVDPFSFYIFPETVQDNEDVFLMFEDCMLPYEVYASMTDFSDPDKGFALPLNPSKIQAPEWPYHLIERLAYRGLTNPSDFAAGFDNQGYLYEKDFSDRKGSVRDELTQRSRKFVQVSNVHFRMGANWFKAWIVYNYSEDGSSYVSQNTKFQTDGRNFQPKIVKLEQIERAPLYQWAVQRPLPGELYTNSMMDDIRVLQILANNQLSQVEANRAVVAEPPVGINVSEGTNRTQSYRYAPRAKWEVDGNPNEFIKNLDVKDTSAEGLRIWQVTMGLINSSAGAGTIAEGQPGRNMPRAGFAVNSLINLALSDIQDVADTIEQELLSPSLADIWHVFTEYVPKSQLFKIPGIAKEAGKYFTIDDLYGDYNFSWLGTLQFQDQQSRADRLFKFLEIVGNPEVQQQMAAQGKAVDLAGLIQSIYSEGLGERGLSSIIKDVEQSAQQDPEAQANAQAAQQEAQQQQQQAQQNSQQNAQEHQLNMQQMQQSGAHEMQLKQMEMQHKNQMNQLDLQKRLIDIQSRQQAASAQRKAQ